MAEEFVVGLTGLTGAGKSTWTAAFKKLGCGVVDCDKLARGAADLPQVRAALCAAFGSDIKRSDGTLDRHLIADRAFKDTESTEKLNSITHPAVLAEIKAEMQRLQQSGVSAVIIDAPLLFEGGLDSLCTLTAAVLAPRELRLSRIMKRDGITEASALSRMAAQHDEKFFRQHADCVLDGTFKPQEVPAAAQKQLSLWLGEIYEKKKKFNK